MDGKMAGKEVGRGKQSNEDDTKTLKGSIHTS